MNAPTSGSTGSPINPAPGEPHRWAGDEMAGTKNFKTLWDVPDNVEKLIPEAGEHRLTFHHAGSRDAFLRNYH